MTDQTPAAGTELTFDQRKKALIAQGATRRNEIHKSIDIVRDNLHADRLAKTAVNHLSNAAFNTVENMFNWRSIKNGNLRTLLPLAASAYSIISRRKLVLPILKGSAVTAAVGAGAYFLWRYKQRHDTHVAAERANQPAYGDPGL